MKLISWNVNGIRAVRKKGFNEFIARHKPDVLSIQEPKVGINQLDDVDISLKNYGAYFSLAQKPGYSGVTTYISKHLNFKKSHSGIGIDKYDKEGRVIITEIEDFILYNIYFPSGTTGEVRQDFKYEFLDDVYSHIKKLPKSKRDRLIICGDYNICHREIDIHHPDKATKQELSGFLPDERAWMDKFEALGFVDSFRHIHGDKPDRYSWWSYRAAARQKNLGWRIDYFWVSSSLTSRIQDAKIFTQTQGSDHAPILLQLN